MSEQKKNRKVNIFIAICILIVIGCGIYIACYFLRQNDQKDNYDRIASEAYKPVEEVDDTEPETEQGLQIPIDFEKLQSENPDIYAWISIPGVEAEYPICQSSTDDSYYLDYTVDGTYGLPGSIYTEMANAKDFTDFNTVIYGHHMKNGTMFGGLHKFRDENFMKENSTITIYTPDSILTYEIFAAVTYSDEHILNTYDFSQEGKRQSFLDSVNEIRDMNSPIREDVAVDTNSRIITLSTCIGGQPNNRLLVMAVLVNEEK